MGLLYIYCHTGNHVVIQTGIEMMMMMMLIIIIIIIIKLITN